MCNECKKECIGTTPCKNVYYRLSVLEIEDGKITKVGNISTLKKLLK